MEEHGAMGALFISKPTDPPQGVPYKMHYFGQRAYAEDFTADQVFHESMRHFHNQVLHSSGIVEGLFVSISDVDQGSFTISPGSAVDQQGREIIVMEEVAGSGLDSTKENYLYIKYEEWMGQNMTLTASNCIGILRKDYASPPPMGSTATGYPYIQYSYQVWIEEDGIGNSEEGILLATIRKSSSGWQIDTSVRVYAASKLPVNASFENLASKRLYFADSGHKGFIEYRDAETSAKLVIGCENNTDSFGIYQNGGERLVIKNGNVGIGTQTPSQAMQVAGNVMLSSKGYRGLVSDDLTVNVLNVGSNEDGSFGVAIKAVQPKGCWSDGIRLDLCTIRTNNVNEYVPRLSISAFTGNVGIGTVNPTAKLEVIGDSLFNGITCVTGDLDVYGSAKVGRLTFSTPVDCEKNCGPVFIAYEQEQASSKLVVGCDGTPNPIDLEVSGRIKDGAGYVMPKGGIIMWSGKVSDIPQGWALCDGNIGTPNLSGKFIVSYDINDTDYDETGKTGGEKKHKLSSDEMPSHSHRLLDDGKHTHDIWPYYTWYLRKMQAGNDDRCVDIANTITQSTKVAGHTHIIGECGSDLEHENRPPYYVLAFIIKL